jgi:hypothetical protein
MKNFYLSLYSTKSIPKFFMKLFEINRKNQIQHDTPCTPKLLDLFISYNRIGFIPPDVELRIIYPTRVSPRMKLI